ncbi:MAG: YihA family ribosome biosis GTP-binding protein [Caproiciproducens sp.]|jgi:GTP-binding protein|nr:YihA family ribosome biosis GTP-binding protein [Caproiciproducens sp.]
MKFEDAFFEFAAGRLDQLPESTVPEIVFSGRSNVGKSTLINKLLNRKSLARVSATPGKTGTINFYNLKDCRLVDLPGYGYAKVSQSEKLRWAELVEGYLNAQRNVKLVIQIIDMRHNPTIDDLHMIDFLLNSDFNFLVAATKSDKLNKTERIKQLEILDETFSEVDDMKLIPFSAVNGEGVEEIKNMIITQCDNQ